MLLHDQFFLFFFNLFNKRIEPVNRIYVDKHFLNDVNFHSYQYSEFPLKYNPNNPFLKTKHLYPILISSINLYFSIQYNFWLFLEIFLYVNLKIMPKKFNNWANFVSILVNRIYNLYLTQRSHWKIDIKKSHISFIKNE